MLIIQMIVVVVVGANFPGPVSQRNDIHLLLKKKKNVQYV